MEKRAQTAPLILSLGILVCPTCPVHSIAQAVSQARPGEVVSVKSGTYFESQILITKPVLIRAENGKDESRPTVDARGNGNVFLIRSSGVEISGLRIENSGTSYVSDLAGIKVESGDRCVLRDNEILNCFFAIHVGGSTGCVIQGNRILGTPTRGESASGNGIHLWHDQRMRILDNLVSGQRDGIYFEFVNDSEIAGNTSEKNLRYGLHFMYSNRNSYRDNTFRRNGSGVAVMFSSDVKMSRNRFEDSWGGAAYGLLLKEIRTSQINSNLFSGNTVGIFLDDTTRSEFEHNEFRSNGWAIRVLGNSDTNRFARNNFVDNTFDVSTNSSANQNLFSENYWSDYTGVDLDHDGIGDTPFHPVRLSSVLMEKFGVSVLLLKSFFFTIADQAEAALPVLTPDALRDERPLMKRSELP